MRWHLDLIVAGSASAESATRITTVRGGGSSMLFKRAFAEGSFKRSASNNKTHFRGPSIGAACISGRMLSRTSRSIEYSFAVGRNSTTSGWRPRATRVSPVASTSAPANARAPSSAPEPRGPIIK
ncbi:unannotated protein [freshwater metagenome]|uniref:Unannotated protein n=1 Tax=freshwater metagenome TaxID=449393 RepID=A0A6J7KUI1_9ZZZZ